MHELIEEGVTIVEDINKKREPLPCLEAIYLVNPTKDVIGKIIDDFRNPKVRLYKAAHLFFMQECPDKLLKKLKGDVEIDTVNKLMKRQEDSFVVRCIKTCKEIELAFKPYESKVYIVDSPELFNCYYNPGTRKILSMGRKSSPPSNLVSKMESVADQIGTLCATLGEYPAIRYKSNVERNAELAAMVELRLEHYKEFNPTMGENRGQSQLVILDRSMDAITPLLHELTLQAMVYDLLKIENDIYNYDCAGKSEDEIKEIRLSDDDELWSSLRHKHIAVVSKKITKGLKRFAEDKSMKAEHCETPKQLSQMIKKMPQYQKEFQKYQVQFRIAEQCLKEYEKSTKKFCKVEQNLVIGIDSDTGEEVDDPILLMGSLLTDPDVDMKDKMRLILLYILVNDGVTEQNFFRLTHLTKVSDRDTAMIHQLNLLGLNTISESETVKKPKWSPNRKNRITEDTYSTSRWTPVIKDVIEEIITGQIDRNLLPFYGDRRPTGGKKVASSARYGGWFKKNTSETSLDSSKQRLIIYILGGVTYSEIRCVYEAAKEQKQWDIIIGSDQILTPEIFMENLKGLDTNLKRKSSSSKLRKSIVQ